jgi:hypothetical protein
LGAIVVASAVVVTLSSTTQTSPASAATLLVKAANLDSAQPPLPALGPGQYYYQQTDLLQSCSFALAGSNQSGSNPATVLTYLTPTTSQTWTSSNGSGSEQSVPQGIGHFQTPGEQTIWAASGQSNPCVEFESTNTRTVPPASSVDPGVTSLPNDPNTLGALIAAGRVNDVGQVTPSSGVCPSQAGDSRQVFAPGQVCNVAAQFDIVNNLLSSPEGPAKLGSVLYQILAKLPGVEIIGTQTDSLGRSGTAIEDPSSGAVVVLDPTTGSLLETETLATSTTSSSGVPVGSVLWSASYGEVSVVDTTGSVAQ